MANLTPTPSWDDVPQLETTTPLLGGAGGPMNAQAQALLSRTELLDRIFGGASVTDPRFAGGAKPGGTVASATAIQAALDSGATYVYGGGNDFLVDKLLTVPAGVTFDGQGGALRTDDGAGSRSVILTGGAGATIENWTICSNVPGVRKGFYGLLIDQPNTNVRNVAFRDITYTALFNDAEGTQATGIYAENCGWDAVSNFARAKNSTFRNVKGVRNGRSLFSTDAGAKGIVLDGFESIDNGLDEITSEHKDVLHFEYATDCVCRNGVIRYTAGYTGGTINQTWAMMRWNASVNCVIENVYIKLESSANGKLILGLVDTTGADGNTGCAALNINVDANAIPNHKLQFIAYDGAARFRLIGGIWRGQITIESGAAGGNAFGHISGIDASGTGTGTFMLSQYVTSAWVIERINLRGYQTAYNLNGFRNSSLRDLEIDGANFNVFYLLNSNTGAAYQPDGGVIANIVLRGTTGTILQTNNQQTRALLVSGIRVDGGAIVGLDTTGGTAGATTANVKAIGNVVGGALGTVQSGTNTAGALNANLNNLTQ